MMQADVRDYLRTFVTERKLTGMQERLDLRTRAVSFVFEDFYYPHNVHAALRSIECCGFQDIHVIDNRHVYGKNVSVTKGAEYWLTMSTYGKRQAQNTQTCFSVLRDQGYMIVGASPGACHYTLETVPLTRKIAVVFGSEENGLSDYARAHVDAYVTIPMYGFTQSFNASVSVGIVSYALRQRLQAGVCDWGLTQQERDMLELAWLRRIVKNSALIEKHFHMKKGLE